jgi:hypothetical protein
MMQPAYLDLIANGFPVERAIKVVRHKGEAAQLIWESATIQTKRERLKWRTPAYAIGRRKGALEEDCSRMLEDSLLLDDAEPFDELIARCGEIENKANASG